MLAIDCSNYQGSLTAATLRQWKVEGVGLVIPQAINPPPAYPPGVTRQQILACVDASMPVDAYLWVWTNSNVRTDIQAKLTLLNGLERHIGRLWLDAEDTAGATIAARITAISQAFELMDAWSNTHGKPRPGVYTGRWWWTGYAGNDQSFKDRDLWDADYDGVADIDHGWQPYGGWAKRAIKQFKGEPLDTNVLSAAEEARVLGTAPAPQPSARETPEDWAWPTWYEAAVNLKGISDQLGRERDDAVAKLAKVRELVA